jgi:hypothetical protein
LRNIDRGYPQAALLQIQTVASRAATNIQNFSARESQCGALVRREIAAGGVEPISVTP